MQQVNRELSIVGPIMNHLNSTGVFFTKPSPVNNLPMLPGKLIRKIETATPLMVGEFQHDDGTNYAMIVNLSLRESTNIKIEKTNPSGKIEIVFSGNDTSNPSYEDLDLTLLSGQGVLLKIL